MEENKLTLEELKKFAPHTTFRRGTGHPNGSIHIPFKWVAKRGLIPDWAVYYGSMDMTWEKVEDIGDKLYNMDLIKQLVNCDDKVLKNYRL